MPQIFLLKGTTTWTVPDDCVSANIDTIGAGSGGTTLGGAGAGGAWSGIIGLALTPRTVITVAVGVGGTSGSIGGDTWFNGASLGAASVGAKGGGAPATTTGGTGGQASGRPNSGNTTGNNGGNGGSTSTDAGGGGGAGGPNGAGNNGANGSVGGGGNGGQGDSTSGGAGGAGGTTGTAGVGGGGTEYDASHGSGGGGGGCTTGTAGAGGNFGGGGGGALAGGAAGGGNDGLIRISYVSAFVNKRPPIHFVESPDDSSGWTFAPRTAFSALLASVLPTTLMRAPFYAPRPADDFIWRGPTPKGKNLNLISSTTPVPFIPSLWKFGQDDSSGWQGKSLPRNINLVPTAVNEPFANYSWNRGYSDSDNWQQSNALGSATFYTLLSPTLPNTILRTPFYAPRPADDPSGWQFKVPFNFATASVAQTPSARGWYYSPPEDLPAWQQTRPKNINLTPGTIATPFTYIPWKFGYDDSAPGWQLFSRAKNENLIPVVNEAFIYVPWKFGQDDSSGWQGKSLPRNTNLVPVVNEAFIYKPWSGGNEDSSSWTGKSSARNINLIGTVVNSPFIYVPWKFGVDDVPNWQFQAPFNFAVASIVQFPPIRDLYYSPPDDTPAWQSPSEAKNINLVPSTQTPAIKVPWKFGYDDSSGWQFTSKGNTLLRDVTVGGQASTPIWKFVTRPYDDPFWQFLGRVNVTVTNPPKIFFPTIQNTYFNNVDDPAPWRYSWHNPNIFYPASKLMTDPRFVSMPLAFNAVLPSNFGASRRYVTTPSSRFPSMPYGNDFSVIDPTVEKVTTTFNFDPWLASGVTITSIVSITVTNASVSLTQDPNPQAIVFGSPQIGPVPPAFPGAPAGAANRSVLQQLANCQPNVTYLLQCLVLTSDSQELNLAAHLPCNQLN